MKFLAIAPGLLLLLLTACSSRQDKAPYESRVAVPGRGSASALRPVKSSEQQDEIHLPSSSAKIEQKQPQPRQQRSRISDPIKPQPKQQQQAKRAKQPEQIELIEQSVMAKMEQSSKSHNFLPDSKLRWKWPVKGKVISSYRPADQGRRGILISGVDGKRISATESGEVVYSDDGLTGYGQLIIIKHNTHYLSVYAHNRKRLVTTGEWVNRGSPIATMGRVSGKAVLHFEIRRDGEAQNPMKYLGKF